jgi:hypothetical protein
MLFVFDDQFGDGVADCEAASDAVVLEVGVLPQVGVATLIAGQASASMTRRPGRTRRAAVATEVGLDGGTSCWNGPSTSATNIEAGLGDRVCEVRDRGLSWALIGVALGMTRQSA